MVPYVGFTRCYYTMFLQQTMNTANILKIAMTTNDAWKSVQNNSAGDHWSILISIQLELPVFR